jgi:glycolate oxidase FAD binding subunit
MSDAKNTMAQIAAIVGEAGIIPNTAAYAIDGMAPTVVAAPDSAEQVSRLLAFANDNGLAVVPWGGGVAMSMGGAPRQLDIVLSTQRLAKVIDYSPEDMTVTAQAGVTLAELQTLLAGRAQMLPLDPPLPERSTVGGILATNASGPLRYQFGMPRDLVLGTHVVYADGTIAKAGGRTVKNVAGYDMTRLHIGAFGTLGVITEATFKVSPLPKVMVTAAGVFTTLAAAAAAAKALRMARIVPWSLVLVSPGAIAALPNAYTVAVRLGGQPAVVAPQAERALQTLREAHGEQVGEVANAEQVFWPAVRDWPATVGGDTDVLLRLGVAPSQTEQTMAALDTAAARHQVQATSLALPGAATIYGRLVGTPQGITDVITGLLTVAKERNGNLVIERAPHAIKERLPVWGLGAADALTQRVKQTFDAKAILNPGRFVGGI